MVPLDAHGAFINLASYGKVRPERVILIKARGLCGWMHSRLSSTWLPMGRTALYLPMRSVQVAWLPEPTDAPAHHSASRACRGLRPQRPRGPPPAGCRRLAFSGLSLPDFAKTGIKDPQPPPTPPWTGGVMQESWDH